MKNKNLSDKDIKKNAIRNRAKLYLYIQNGIKKLLAYPIFGVLVLFFFATVVLVMLRVTEIFTTKVMAGFPFTSVVVLAAKILLTCVFILVAGAFLYLIGTPNKAKEIERDLSEVFDTTREYYRTPFLVSCQSVKKGSAKEYVFWSRWIDLERWNRPENKEAVLWTLYIRSYEEFRPGSKKHTVAIKAGPGIEAEERETPKDPLFM